MTGGQSPRFIRLDRRARPPINFQTGYYTARVATAIKYKRIRRFDPAERFDRERLPRSRASLSRFLLLQPRTVKPCTRVYNKRLQGVCLCYLSAHVRRRGRPDVEEKKNIWYQRLHPRASNVNTSYPRSWSADRLFVLRSVNVSCKGATLCALNVSQQFSVLQTKEKRKFSLLVIAAECGK